MMQPEVSLKIIYMAKRRKSKEELTTEMHSEFSVSEETDRKHIIITAQGVVDDGLMTKTEALKAYGLNKEDLD